MERHLGVSGLLAQLHRPPNPTVRVEHSDGGGGKQAAEDPIYNGPVDPKSSSPQGSRGLPSHWLFHIWAARGLGLALVSPCVNLLHWRVEGQDRMSPREVGDQERRGLTPMAQRQRSGSIPIPICSFPNPRDQNTY